MTQIGGCQSALAPNDIVPAACPGWSLVTRDRPVSGCPGPGHRALAPARFLATGVLIPLGLNIARLTNFAGYVSWCSWLVAMAIALWRNKLQADGSPSPMATVRYRKPARS